MLEEAYKGRMLAFYDTTEKKTNCLQIPDQIECVHGHYSLRHFRPMFPKAQVASWIRNPFDRFCSEFYHIQRGPDTANELHAAIGEGSLTMLDCVNNKSLINTQSKFFPLEEVEKAAFIGLTEYYEEGLQLFTRIFDIRQKANVHPQNINPRKKLSSAYRDDDGVLEAFMEKNSDDLALYEAAKERFFELCEEHRVEVAR